MPWLSLRRFCQKHFWELPAPCLEELRRRLKPGLRTLEAGSGASTRVFEEAGCRHVALEHRREHAPACASVLVVPLVGDPPWYDWTPEGPFDLILVDGPPFWVGRSGILRVLPRCMRKGTVVIVDDVNRSADLRLAERIASEYGLSMELRHNWELGFYRRSFAVLGSP